jgi:hypothetical protein
MGALRPLEVHAKQAWVNTRWLGSRLIASCLSPSAISHYDKLEAEAFDPDDLIKVVPSLRLIYVTVPKAASTRIKATLAAATGRHSLGLKSRLGGPWGPKSMTLISFHRLVTSPTTLRFSFVRNPYARAVSCWADKYQGKPLTPGDDYVDRYLARRPCIDAPLPAGPQHTLSFADFVTYAAASAYSRCDAHLQAQDDILAIPGIDLDLIGKVESFSDDFARVLDHARIGDTHRRASAIPLNRSRHDHWAAYYTDELAARLYHAYERDFDRFQYPRAVGA